MDDLPEKLRFHRRARGWSQEQLARQIGVSLHTVSRWESGKSHPSPLAIERLKALLDDLLSRKQTRLL